MRLRSLLASSLFLLLLAIRPALAAGPAAATGSSKPETTAPSRTAVSSGLLQVPALRLPAGRAKSIVLPPLSRGGFPAPPAGDIAPLLERPLPAAESMINMNALTWTAAPGGRVSKVALRSTGATSLNVQLQLLGTPNNRDWSQLELRLAGTDRVYNATGAFVMRPNLSVWTSPLLLGDTMVIEIFAPTAITASQLGRLALNIAAVGHLLPHRAATPKPVPPTRSKVETVRQ